MIIVALLCALSYAQTVSMTILSSADSQVDFSLTIANQVFTDSILSQGGSITFADLPPNESYFLTGTQQGDNFCGFEVGSTSLFNTMPSEDLVLQWVCSPATIITVPLSSQPSESEFMTYIAEVTTALYTTINGESNRMLIDQEDYYWEYDASTGQILFFFTQDAYSLLSSDFGNTLAYNLSIQPNLSQYFAQQSYSFSFSLSNVNAFSQSELLSMISIASGFPEDSISMGYTFDGTTYSFDVTVYGSGDQINSFSSFYSSGGFESSFQSELNGNAGFSSSVLVMGGPMTITFSLGGVTWSSTSESELISIISSITGVPESSISIEYTTDGSGYIVTTYTYSTSSTYDYVTGLITTGDFESALESSFTSSASFSSSFVSSSVTFDIVDSSGTGSSGETTEAPETTSRTVAATTEGTGGSGVLEIGRNEDNYPSFESFHSSFIRPFHCDSFVT